jgi:two-component system, cell cycle response regulator
MKDTQVINSIAGKIENLPTLPGIAIKLLQAVQKNEPNISEIGEILSKDVALTAKILKLVNSSFYSLSSRITTVDHAIKLLGLNTVKNLALGFSLITGFQKKGVKAIDYRRYWKDSLVGAIAARLLAKKIQPTLCDDAFFMGLLQNIGSLALACCLTEQYSVVLSEEAKDVGNWYQAENEVLGFNHMEVGEYLIKSWGLPEAFYVPISYHHCPQKISGNSLECQIRTKLLHLSALYIDMFNAPDISLSFGTIDHFIKEYGFKDKFDIAVLGKEVHAQAQNVLPIFDIQFKDDRDLAHLLDKAKAEMAKLSVEMINELLEKNKEIEFLREQTTIDSMTSINNYKGFCESLSRELSRAKRYKKPLSLIFADIDHFKLVNDTFGHLAGDHALKAVAVCLKRGLREADYLARYGGEEFAIIIPETNIEGAIVVAERLREKIEALNILFKDKAISLTMSFGVASMPTNQDLSSDNFIKIADDALYKAKGQGRNRCCMIARCA